MRLALFSPLNPQKSGIADYTEELLPHLSAEAEIDLYVDGFKPDNAEMLTRHRRFDYRKNPSVLRQLGVYDAVIYHVGNDHRYHTGIYQTLLHHSGIVVFHDFALQDFFLGLAREADSLAIYLDEIENCYGREARGEAEDAMARGLAPPHVARCAEFPMNERLARRAEGIIVHSEWNRVRFERIAPGVPLVRIPHHITGRAATQKPRTAGGDGRKSIALASFGLITAEKGIERVLRALAALKANYDFRYTLVGEPNPFFDVRERVRVYGLTDRVRVTGHVTLEEFERHITATDIALNLRERTVGETSGSLCRIMAAGVAAVVSNVGWFAELPDDAVVKVDWDAHTDALLVAYLQRLVEDARLRESIGANARRYMLANHTIEQSAQGYLNFIREVVARRAGKNLINHVAVEIAHLGLANNDDFLKETSARIAEIVAAPDAGGRSNGNRVESKVVSKVVRPGIAEDNASRGSEATNATVREDSAENFSGVRQGAINQSPSPRTVTTNRLPKIEGVDYERAAIEYPQKLDAERRHYLLTKPFYNLANRPPKHRGDGMDGETHRHFCDFANIAVALELPAGARVLDVGCGSGWLSEYFARLGYDVTGIDVSPDLVRMSFERLRRVAYGVDHETRLRYRFKAHNIERAPLDERFDAIICYDSLHHLVDEESVLRHLAQMLPVGGKLFILEGNKPPEDSATEAELVGVMRDYGTLESPFDSAYLQRLLRQHGFAIVGDYVGVNDLFERETLRGGGVRVSSVPEVNYLLCRKVVERGSAAHVADSRNPGLLRARLAVRQRNWDSKVKPDAPLRISLVIENTGDALWLGGERMRRGVVMLGVKTIDKNGQVINEDHGGSPLPRSVLSSEKISLEVITLAPSAPGAYQLKIDLVSQEVCWFEERGSSPLVLEVEVTGEGAPCAASSET